MRNRAHLKKYAWLSLPSPRNLAVTFRPGKGGEKSIKIKEIKMGEEKLTLVTRKKSASILLKNKTTSSHKVIYFKRNKLCKIRLCIFFPMLVEKIELGNKNNIHSSNDNIIPPPK